MKYMKTAVATFLLASLFISGCKKGDDAPKTLLSNSYVGTMTFEYTKGFPAFTAISTLDVSMDKDGIFTCGAFQTSAFDEEAIKYEDGKPVMKIHSSGSVKFDGAEGLFEVINGEDKILIYLHSIIVGSNEIYGYDDEQGFILVEVDDYTYEDKFEDGTWEFSLDDAIFNGSKIIVTYPDIEGISKYGYSLYLVPSLNP